MARRFDEIANSARSLSSICPCRIQNVPAIQFSKEKEEPLQS
ncbi:hypothetical protein B4135_2306 [Caldibacillus debilis]|uniref:Uncharacterized protein n=1 Tax=Caldibacillus debilis TaxID=301148 RepID=A0A150M2D6_9BACI|nr:hypothetical protein B4135_2306 [Caldibacillus debilis]